MLIHRSFEGSNVKIVADLSAKAMIIVSLFVLIVPTLNAGEFTRIETAIKEWWNTGPKASAVVVRVGNKVIYEQYELNQQKEDLMPIYSVTKSIASILTGIALYQGYLTSLDTPIADYLSEEMHTLDQETRSITIRHVLTMTTGLKSDWSMEGRPITSFRGDLDNSALALVQIDKPGTISRYSTLVSNLMAGVLEAAVRQELEQFTAAQLFTPLGITSWSWHRDDTDRATLGAGLRLKTTDMARIGQLVLNGGTFNGKRLLDEAYLQEATSALYEMELPNGEYEGYGFFFWRSKSTPVDHFIAEGYAQQMIYGVPDLDLVVAVSAPCCSAVDESAYVLVQDHIIPALQQ